MSSTSRPARVAELSPTATMALVGTFAVAGAAGYFAGGVAGAFFCAVGVTSVAGAAWVLVRARRADRTRFDAVPDVRSLPPAQALSVMGALVEGSSFRSELLNELGAIDEQIEQEPAAALVSLGELVKQRPRNPAIHERIARAHLANGDPSAAARSVTEALACALDGGMNPMAARVFETFGELRDELTLSRSHRNALAKVLRTHGDTEAAAWCESASPED